VYIRFGRAAVPVIHKEENYSFEIGKAEVLRPGTDVAVAATGLMVAEALKAAETLAAEGINVRVINVCSIKPLDEETILAAARECGKIVTCEEHSVIRRGRVLSRKREASRAGAPRRRERRVRPFRPGGGAARRNGALRFAHRRSCPRDR